MYSDQELDEHLTAAICLLAFNTPIPEHLNVQLVHKFCKLWKESKTKEN